MNITSIIFRVLTILLVGGSFTLWHMARSNLKEKLGGDPKDPYLGTTIDSLVKEQTELAYEVLGTDEDWKLYEEQKKLFNDTVAQKDPTTVLSISELKSRAIEKLISEDGENKLQAGDGKYQDNENINSKVHAENDQFTESSKYPHRLAPKFYDVDKPNGVPEILEKLPEEIGNIGKSPEKINLIFQSHVAGENLTETLSNKNKAAKDALKALMEKKGYQVSKELKVKSREKTISSNANAQDKLKAAFAKFFWEREKLFGEINALRQKVADKDEQIIQLQIKRVAAIAQEDIWKGKDQDGEPKFDGEVKYILTQWQESYKKGETEKDALQVEIGGVKEKLEETKANLQATELAKQELDDEWKTKMKDTRENYEGQLQETARDKVSFGQDEYLRGWTEATKEFKGEIAGTEEKTRPNYFDEKNPLVPVEETDTPAEGEGTLQQPVTTNLTVGQNNPVGEGLQEPKFDGIMTNVLRVLPRDGLIMLYIGSENGLSNGNLFTLVKEGRQTARIKITDTKPKYCVANILPAFGDPRNLRAGDQVQVVR